MTDSLIRIALHMMPCDCNKWYDEEYSNDTTKAKLHAGFLTRCMLTDHKHDGKLPDMVHTRVYYRYDDGDTMSIDSYTKENTHQQGTWAQ